MKLYNTIKINNHSYYINDEDGDSCYLIIGNTHALLIDLGLFKEPLLPTIKNITNKELIIVCTHGHFDHIGTIKLSIYLIETVIFIMIMLILLRNFL